MPRKLEYLTDRLPKSNYTLNKSYDLASGANHSIDHPRKK